MRKSIADKQQHRSAVIVQRRGGIFGDIESLWSELPCHRQPQFERRQNKLVDTRMSQLFNSHCLGADPKMRLAFSKGNVEMLHLKCTACGAQLKANESL